MIFVLLAAGLLMAQAPVIGPPAAPKAQTGKPGEQLAACTARLKASRDQRSALVKRRADAQRSLEQVSAQPNSDQRDAQIQALQRTLAVLDTQIGQVDKTIDTLQAECNRLRGQTSR